MRESKVPLDVIPPESAFVYVHQRDEQYGAGSYVQWIDKKIYYVIRCPDIWLGTVKDDCYWYWGQDYELFDATNSKDELTADLPHIGYRVNGVDIYEYIFLMSHGGIKKGDYFFLDDKIYQATADITGLDITDSRVLGFAVSGIYVFYPDAFPQFEAGMYIYSPTITHPLNKLETQVFYAVYRTLVDVKPPFNFQDINKFVSAGIVSREWGDCDSFSWNLRLFYSEYPCCWDLTKGEFVYTEENHGYNKIGQAIYEITKVPFKGCGDLTTQTKVLSTQPVPWKNNDIYWVYDFDNSPVYHKGAYIYYKDGKIYQSYDCEQKIYPDDDECIWHWGQDYKMYRIINGVNTHVGWIVNGSMQVFFDQYSEYAEEGNFLFKDDAIYQIGNVNVCTVTINQSDNQHITVVVNGVRTHTDSFKVYSGALLQCSIESDDGYTAGTLNIYGTSVTTDLTIEATPAVANQ